MVELPTVVVSWSIEVADEFLTLAHGHGLYPSRAQHLK